MTNSELEKIHSWLDAPPGGAIPPEALRLFYELPKDDLEQLLNSAPKEERDEVNDLMGWLDRLHKNTRERLLNGEITFYMAGLPDDQMEGAR